MKTPLQLATEHARSIVANRGQWVEPLTWEEIELLVDAVSTTRVYLQSGCDCGCEQAS
jgi:hypothetical protein